LKKIVNLLDLIYKLTIPVKLKRSKEVIGVNDKFLELPEEKRNNIINAGLEIFGRNGYTHASTEEIAVRAGISKGLLFYYFHNKRAFYTFLFEWAVSQVKSSVLGGEFDQITDFFQLCEYAAKRKYALLHQSPHIMDFLMRAFYSRQDAASGEINRKIAGETADIFSLYFTRVDFSKFRDDVDPKEISQMLVWVMDGYLHEQQLAGQSVDLDDVMEKFRLWSAWFRKISYKEEFSDECGH